MLQTYKTKIGIVQGTVDVVFDLNLLFRAKLVQHLHGVLEGAGKVQERRSDEFPSCVHTFELTTAEEKG